MIFLIDGHNLIGKTPGLRLEDPDDEAQLVALLDSACRRLRTKAVVFFDPGLHRGNARLGTHWVEVRFARDTADEAIQQFLQQKKDRGEYTVITSDQKVARWAKQLRAHVRSSEHFAEELGAPARPADEADDAPPSPKEVEELLALFEARKTKRNRKAN